MSMWTDDPVRDFHRHEAEQEERRSRRRVGRCLHCRETVYDYEDYYDIEGDLLHEDCLMDWAAQYKK